MLTGIVIALPDEINSLTNKKVAKGECISLDENTLLVCSGAGSDNATKASQLLIKNGAKRLISWGCAAALKPELTAGDLIIPQTLKTENQESISLTSPWLTYVTQQLSHLNPLIETLIESTTIVAESSQKQAIHQQSGAIALDMESIAIAKVAQQHNYPILVIRCIADPVTMSLPKAVSHALNDQGDVVLSKLLWFLATHPQELPSLIALGLHFKSAKNKLKLVSEYLDTICNFEQDTASK